MLLQAYKINGQIINIDKFNWSKEQLNGNLPWIVNDTLQENYADISSISAWYEIGFGICDYLYTRDQIRSIYNTIGFNNLTPLEKKITGQLFIASKSERDTIFTEEIQKEYWDIVVEQSQQCRLTRWEHAKKYISYKLPIIDSCDLANDTNILCNNYINYNITNIITDGVNGLFDYLQGTNNYITNGYPSKTYWSQLDQDTIMSILQNGMVGL